MKLFSGLLLAALMSAPLVGFADQIVREATAKVAVIKTTYANVNGRYESTDSKVCSVQVPVPVRDMRLPGATPPKYWGEVSCESTIQSKPVVISTTLVTMITKGDSPWDKGKVLDLKGAGANSYVYAKNSDIPQNLIQENVFINSFTEDLNLKTLVFELVPKVNLSIGSCTAEPGKPTTCPNNPKANFEEYFSVYVFIEDKN